MKQINDLKKIMLTGLLFSFGQLYAQDVHVDWAKSMGSPADDYGYSVAVDTLGNVYTTGSFSGTVDFDPGPNSFNLTAADGTDVFISKLDANGNFEWAKRYGGKRNDAGNSVALDPSGKVLITGSFVEEMDFTSGPGANKLVSQGETEIFVAKLDTAGNCLWANSYGSPEDQDGISIAADILGNVYVTGNLYKGQTDMNPGGTPYLLAGPGVFILKLDVNGNSIWAKKLGEGATLPVSGNALATSLSTPDFIYLAGQYVGTVDFDPGSNVHNLTVVPGQSNYMEDVFVLKLNSAGGYVWAKSMGGTGRDYGNGIATDSSDNVYTIGAFEQTADFDPGSNTVNLIANGTLDIFISKLDANGNYSWAKSVGAGKPDYGFSIAVDPSQNVFATGIFADRVDFNPGLAAADTSFLSSNLKQWDPDAFVLKLDASGGFAWAKRLGGSSGIDGGMSVALHKNSIYTAGHFQNWSDFDPGPDTLILYSKGGNADVFIQKMSCESGTSTLKISACGAYTLNHQTYTETGTYTEHLYAHSGCDSIITLDLTINEIIHPQITVKAFDLSTTMSYAGYQWFLNGNAIPGATSHIYTVTQNGTYTVAVESREGCRDTSDAYRVTNAGTSINDPERLSKKINIYPNPANDIIHIIAPFKVNVTLTSLEGKIIKQQSNVHTVSVKALAPGVYLLRLSDQQGNFIKVKKLVKTI